MRILDLFSGIGGFALAGRMAGLPAPVAFCEIEPFCQRVLAKHWPEVPCATDISYLCVDKRVNMLYDCRHGKNSSEICGYCGIVRKWSVDSGGCRPVRSDSPSDVANTETSWCEDAEKPAIWEKEPLLSGNICERSGAKYPGKSCGERDNPEKECLRKLRSCSDFQRWEDRNPGASSRLQHAADGDVALPKVPPRMAQKKYPAGKEVMPCEVSATIDLVCGGFP